jgi:integrase
MSRLSRRFARLPALDRDEEAALLAALDNSLRAICRGTRDAAQREALAALTGMRRDLFPQAPAYDPSTLTAYDKEIQ